MSQHILVNTTSCHKNEKWVSTQAEEWWTAASRNNLNRDGTENNTSRNSVSQFSHQEEMLPVGFTVRGILLGIPGLNRNLIDVGIHQGWEQSHSCTEKRQVYRSRLAPAPMAGLYNYLMITCGPSTASPRAYCSQWNHVLLNTWNLSAKIPGSQQPTMLASLSYHTAGSIHTDSPKSALRACQRQVGDNLADLGDREGIAGRAVESDLCLSHIQNLCCFLCIKRFLIHTAEQSWVDLPPLPGRVSRTYLKKRIATDI